jgi:hypothetical protein
MLIDDSELVFGELHYERRLVAYFDVLGWRADIEQAGADPRRLGRLALVVRAFSALAVPHEGRHVEARLSSFSDNVVFSIPFGHEQAAWTLRNIAVIQLGLAMIGFWIRGGVTVGSLYHDDKIVFGPALVRAAAIESEEAGNAVVLLDHASDELVAFNERFIAVEGGRRFLDPYTAAFADESNRDVAIQRQALAQYNALVGTSLTAPPSTPNRHSIIHGLLSRISHEISYAASAPVRAKHAWQFDRLAARMGISTRAVDLPDLGQDDRD